MPTIVAISGSVRRKSFNTMLLRAVIAAAPLGTTVQSASIADIPLYNGDVEAESGVPESVRALKDQIAAGDALLLVTPEYNNSLPGVFKNAIDWASRPNTDVRRVFGGRPVGVIGATPGGGGTILAQAAWLPVFRTLGMVPYFGVRVIVSGAARVFDDQGSVQDPAVQGQIEKYVAGFAEFSSRHSVKRA
jgi:NAD(P)H-dependent FMN reductase